MIQVQARTKVITSSSCSNPLKMKFVLLIDTCIKTPKVQIFYGSKELSMKFLLPINIKMSTMVGILIFIGRIYNG